MTVFFARNLDSTDLEPLFLEVEDGHISLRARSVLHEVLRLEGRVVTREPLHSGDGFELADAHGHTADVIESSSSGGLFADRINIVFPWPWEIRSGDRFSLTSDKASAQFTAEANDGQRFGQWATSA